MRRISGARCKRCAPNPRANAARWIGSLLHFTTDTGSPPHAAGIPGQPVHSKMENWVNAKLIHIPDYQPRLLGNDDAAAEAGFLRRMDGLIEFSKQRAQRCRADGTQVFLRTKAGKPGDNSPPADSAPASPGAKEVVITGSPEAAWAQVCLRTPQPPDAVLDAVSLSERGRERVRENIR